MPQTRIPLSLLTDEEFLGDVRNVAALRSRWTLARDLQVRILHSSYGGNEREACVLYLASVYYKCFTSLQRENKLEIIILSLEVLLVNMSKQQSN